MTNEQFMMEHLEDVLNFNKEPKECSPKELLKLLEE